MDNETNAKVTPADKEMALQHPLSKKESDKTECPNSNPGGDGVSGKKNW